MTQPSVGYKRPTWRDWVVKVVDWDYDDWMDLEIRQRQLERVTQAP